MKRATPTVALMVAVAAGCTGAAPARVPASPWRPPSPSRQVPPASVSNVPAWTYWEPVDEPVVVAALDPVELPLAPAELVRSAALEARWQVAPPALRDAIASRGFAVMRNAHPSGRLGELYASLRDAGIPWVVTIDALFFLAHLAFDQVLAEVDAHGLAPLVSTMLHRVEVRLATEGRTARADVAPSFVVARGTVAVALALAEPAYAAAPDITRLVAAEKARAIARAGIEVSPLLGVPMDYSAMSPVGMADRDPERAGWFRAVAWLQAAALHLEGAGEHDASATVDVAIARLHARAALLLAHAVDGGVDAVAASAWDRVERAGELMIGGTDAVSPRDLSVSATRAGLDMGNADWIGNVVRVDRVRHAAAGGHVAAAFILFGPRAAPDTDVLGALSFPSVGARDASSAPVTWGAPDNADPPAALGHRVRALPTALDVAAWLGAGEARAALHDSGDDAYERYDETIELLMHARAADASSGSPDLHRSPYLSTLDAIGTWLTPSAGDAVQPAAATSEWRKRKADVALAAWTELRHDATALTGVPLGDARLPPPVSGQGTVPWFVEPHPEAIAKLVGLVRQIGHALSAEGILPSGSPALALLHEVDDLLWTSLGAAVYETADESLPPRLEAALSAFPARMVALEAALGDAAEVPLAADVHIAASRALEEVTGRVDEIWLVMREPATHRQWLAIGASIPHYEIVQPASRRQSDSAWRARLQAEGDPPPGPLERAYRVEAEPGSP